MRVSWAVEIGDECAPEFDNPDEDLRLEILAFTDPSTNSGRNWGGRGLTR